MRLLLSGTAHSVNEEDRATFPLQQLTVDVAIHILGARLDTRQQDQSQAIGCTRWNAVRICGSGWRVEYGTSAGSTRLQRQ